MLLTSACWLFYQIRFKQRIISILSQQSADKSFQQWGDIIRKVAVLIPDERCLVLFEKKYCTLITKTKAFHPGPVLPPSGEGSSLKSVMSKYWWFFGQTSTRFPSVSSIACMATNPFNHLYCFFIVAIGIIPEYSSQKVEFELITIFSLFWSWSLFTHLLSFLISKQWLLTN